MSTILQMHTDISQTSQHSHMHKHTHTKQWVHLQQLINLFCFHSNSTASRSLTKKSNVHANLIHTFKTQKETTTKLFSTAINLLVLKMKNHHKH